MRHSLIAPNRQSLFRCCLNGKVSNRFLANFLFGVPAKCAFKALVENSVACDSLAAFTLSDDICSSFCCEYDFDEVKEFLRRGSSQLLFWNRLSLFKFIKSDYYSDWRAREMEATVKFVRFFCQEPTTLPELLTHTSLKYLQEAQANFSEDATFLDKGNITLSFPLYSDADHEVEAHEIENDVFGTECSIHNAIKSCDQLQISKMQDNCSWLLMLIVAVETVPIAVTVSQAGSGRPVLDQPIIYANKHFEVVSGFSRDRMVGHPAAYMQSMDTLCLLGQNEILQRILFATITGNRHIEKIICADSSGLFFQTTCGTSPIFDSQHQLCYVITMHIVCEQSKDLEGDARLMNALLQTIPRSLYDL